MLTPAAMLNLAAELTDAQAQGDAESLAAIAWQLYGQVGEDLAEIARLRAAIHAAWNRSSPAGTSTGVAGPRAGRQAVSASTETNGVSGER